VRPFVAAVLLLTASVDPVQAADVVARLERIAIHPALIGDVAARGNPVLSALDQGASEIRGASARWEVPLLRAAESLLPRRAETGSTPQKLAAAALARVLSESKSADALRARVPWHLREGALTDVIESGRQRSAAPDSAVAALSAAASNDAAVRQVFDGGAVDLGFGEFDQSWDALVHKHAKLRPQGVVDDMNAHDHPSIPGAALLHWSSWAPGWRERTVAVSHPSWSPKHWPASERRAELLDDLSRRGLSPRLLGRRDYGGFILHVEEKVDGARVDELVYRGRIGEAHADALYELGRSLLEAGYLLRDVALSGVVVGSRALQSDARAYVVGVRGLRRYFGDERDWLPPYRRLEVLSDWLLAIRRQSANAPRR
jgi:hypothetical protein